MAYSDIIVEVGAGVVEVTINRPAHGNMFRKQTALELADALREFRSTAQSRVLILTGAGKRFFCVGGEHEGPTRPDYADVMPIVDVYELIDAIPKPIIAAVNGFAVGGGHVLHVVCDLTIAAESATFRQVGPLVGSFDPGFGTWYLEETIGRKRAKEMWFLNKKYSSHEALTMGLVNEVVPDEQLMQRCRDLADELLHRGPGALAALKGAFSARHSGVLGQARLGHDQLLSYYLNSEEHEELAEAFRAKRSPDIGRFLR